MTNPESVYYRAHHKATPQTTVLEQSYNLLGQKIGTRHGALRTEWYVTNKKGEQQIIRRNP